MAKASVYAYTRVIDVRLVADGARVSREGQLTANKWSWQLLATTRCQSHSRYPNLTLSLTLDHTHTHTHTHTHLMFGFGHAIASLSQWDAARHISSGVWGRQPERAIGARDRTGMDGGGARA